MQTYYFYLEIQCKSNEQINNKVETSIIYVVISDNCSMKMHDYQVIIEILMKKHKLQNQHILLRMNKVKVEV